MVLMHFKISCCCQLISLQILIEPLAQFHYQHMQSLKARDALAVVDLEEFQVTDLEILRECFSLTEMPASQNWIKE